MGHYKVIENIGQGNMGQVDRATDTKLNRGVAIKVLAEHLSKRGSPLSQRGVGAWLRISAHHGGEAPIRSRYP